jgi:hypothetical protein
MVDECEEFYKVHRGGSGAVIVVTAVHDDTHEERMGIFGSAETAHEWRRSLPDNFICVFAPYIVDDPDWGNEADTRRK